GRGASAEEGQAEAPRRPPPPPQKSPGTRAGRRGGGGGSHWKTATFGWLALVVVAFGIGGMIGTKNPDPNTSGPGESGRMDRILDAGFKPRAAESVFIQSSKLRAGTPEFGAVVQGAPGPIARGPGRTPHGTPQ